MAAKSNRAPNLYFVFGEAIARSDRGRGNTVGSITDKLSWPEDTKKDFRRGITTALESIDLIDAAINLRSGFILESPPWGAEVGRSPTALAPRFEGNIIYVDVFGEGLMSSDLGEVLMFVEMMVLWMGMNFIGPEGSAPMERANGELQELILHDFGMKVDASTLEVTTTVKDRNGLGRGGAVSQDGTRQNCVALQGFDTIRQANDTPFVRELMLKEIVLRSRNRSPRRLTHCRAIPARGGAT